jgi:hypothetical protein
MTNGAPRNQGRRPGRPALGVTRKVSLTLTDDEWEKIDSSHLPSIGAYLRYLMSEPLEIPDNIMVSLMKAIDMQIGGYVDFIATAKRAPHAADLKPAIENHEKYLAETKEAKQWLDEHKKWRWDRGLDLS